jgi:glycosyltransferase involved in cell wall biosynthesis
LRILWVKVGGLWPVNTGGRLRSFHIIDELARYHEVSVLTTHHPAEDGAALAPQLPHCKRVISLPHASAKKNSLRFVGALALSWFSQLPVDLYKSRIAALRREVEQILASGACDLCVADFLFALPNVPLEGKTPVVFFSHNVEYMIWKRLCATETHWLKRAILALEWRKMRRYELAACVRADLTVAVSEEDRLQLAEGAPGTRMFAIPTGVDTTYFQPAAASLEQAGELVFTGSMDWQPNEDAMLYFMAAILPLVRHAIPGVTLTIVGRNPGLHLRNVAAAAGVQVTGTVDDVRPYIARAAVYVVPLRIGGGTRLKIFEALAMGKAVVSTTIGAEGLPLEENVHILRADNPQAFAAGIIALLRDRARSRSLGQAGRRLMEAEYSWARVAADFERYCKAVVNR